MSHARLLPAISFVLCSLGCAGDHIPMAAQVQDELRASLTHGDSPEKIEKLLSAKTAGFSYDRFQSRYHSIIRGKRHIDRAVVIYVNVDSQKKYVSLEAHDSYTGP